MAARKRYRHRKPEEVAQALRDARGLVTVAAERLGCDVKTVYDHIKRSPEVARAREEADDRMLDFAEAKLYKSIQDGELKAIIFFLSTKGKKRGYVPKSELTGLGGAPLVPKNVTFKFEA